MLPTVRHKMVSVKKWIWLILLSKEGLYMKQITAYFVWLNIDLFSRKSIILENRHIATFGA